MDESYSYERYQRQLVLQDFGMEAQEKLRKGRVLIIGAGGLGCPIIQYLVAAGVGHIGIADPDRVSISNLHRQILFGVNDVGAYKVDVVKAKMHSMDPAIRISCWKERWTPSHCLEHFPHYDVVVDATDNFPSRYMINDGAVLTGKPLVYGAVSQYEGQVAVFNYASAMGERSVNYRDLFPDPPVEGEVRNCAEAGVIGVLPGMIGCIQAAEVIKLLTGIGSPLVNRLLTYQLQHHMMFNLQLSANPIAREKIPVRAADFLQMDYTGICGLPDSTIPEISVGEWQSQKQAFLLVDVRESHELPRLDAICAAWSLESLEMPLSSFSPDQLPILGDDRKLLMVCKSGKRSLQAAAMVMNKGPEYDVFSLSGGVDALVNAKLL